MSIRPSSSLIRMEFTPEWPKIISGLYPSALNVQVRSVKCQLVSAKIYANPPPATSKGYNRGDYSPFRR